MPETIAVIGSRKYDRLDIVQTFMVTLAMQQPDSIVVSGGADGVDTTAETEWVRHGGTVVSYRPRAMHKPNQIESWAITKLTMGPNPSVEILAHPTFADIASALFYRNTLIVDDADRVVAFHLNHSSGTAHAKGYAEARGVPVYDMVA